MFHVGYSVQRCVHAYQRTGMREPRAEHAVGAPSHTRPLT